MADYHLHRTIVLVGMMGAGKSAIGRTLASEIGVDFLDSDTEIEAAAASSIADIFARDGEPFFRKREAEVLQRLLGGPPVVLSTGGGAFTVEGNRAMIADAAVSVCLDADLQTLWDRVAHKDTRPLLQTDDPFATLEQIYAARTPVYAQAQMRLPIDPEATIEETTASLVALLCKDAQILEVS